MTRVQKKRKGSDDKSAEHKGHEHKWNEHGTCEICGASPIEGRAYHDLFREGSRPSA
ncbi:MAG: hypothetical protein WBQ14_00460 [Gaiellaceae bacterium]